MKAAKWRDLSEDEVTQKVRDLSEEVFNLRFQLAMGVAKNPSRVGEVRRDLARAYTIIRERGGSPAAVAAAVAPTPVVEAPKRAKAPKAAKKPAKRAAKPATAAAKKPKKKAKG
jgi:large subunit ribosomal protein L29